MSATATHPRTLTPAALSIAQVAQMTGTSKATVRRRIADGTLPAVRIGPRLIRIDPADAEKLLQPNMGAAAATRTPTPASKSQTRRRGTAGGPRA